MSWKKCLWHAVVLIAMVLLTVVVFGILPMYGYFDGFPTRAEVDQFFVDYRTISDDSLRQESVRSFLQSMSNPCDVNDDHLVEYFLDKLRDVYLLTQDENILAAVDQVKCHAGFATSISCFYHSIKNTDVFKKRYINNTQRIKQFEGISFSKEEIDQLEKNK